MQDRKEGEREGGENERLKQKKNPFGWSDVKVKTIWMIKNINLEQSL